MTTENQPIAINGGPGHFDLLVGLLDNRLHNPRSVRFNDLDVFLNGLRREDGFDNEWFFYGYTQKSNQRYVQGTYNAKHRTGFFLPAQPESKKRPNNLSYKICFDFDKLELMYALAHNTSMHPQTLEIELVPDPSKPPVLTSFSEGEKKVETFNRFQISLLGLGRESGSGYQWLFEGTSIICGTNLHVHGYANLGTGGGWAIFNPPDFQ